VPINREELVIARRRNSGGTDARLIAIIVPFREQAEQDRTVQLDQFLHHMGVFLSTSSISFLVLVVKQLCDKKKFNRGQLLNIGFRKAQEVARLVDKRLVSVILHDVDLLPSLSLGPWYWRILPQWHMSIHLATPWNSSMKYAGNDDREGVGRFFGGVTAVYPAAFEECNGLPQDLWGWGGEDDDMANRLRIKKLFISRYPANIARYKMLKHAKDKANPERFKYLYSGAKRMGKDGYNSLKYKKVKLELKPLYTWVLVDLPRLKA
jgi:hypothetical protein